MTVEVHSKHSEHITIMEIEAFVGKTGALYVRNPIKGNYAKYSSLPDYQYLRELPEYVTEETARSDSEAGGQKHYLITVNILSLYGKESPEIAFRTDLEGNLLDDDGTTAEILKSIECPYFDSYKDIKEILKGIKKEKADERLRLIVELTSKIKTEREQLKPKLDAQGPNEFERLVLENELSESLRKHKEQLAFIEKHEKLVFISHKIVN